MHKLALITGGSGYLGSALAACFKERGYEPVSLSRAGGVDITDEVSVQKAVEDAVAQYGEVYACVHAAAAPLVRKPLLNIEPEVFDREVLTAVKGAYLLARAVHAHASQNMTFIGITTEMIEAGESAWNSGAYVPAKYALRGVLRALSLELPRVYAVAPGFLPGGLNGDMPEAVRQMLAQKYASPTAQETAVLIVGLCEGSTIPSGMSVKSDGTYDPL